jgi:V8-like Glu-specific endopeptidase
VRHLQKLILATTLATAMATAAAPAPASTDPDEATLVHLDAPPGARGSAEDWTEDDYRRAVPLDLPPEDADHRRDQGPLGPVDPPDVVARPALPTDPQIMPFADPVPRTVGRLFFKKSDGRTFTCSAAVVNSPSKQLILTAAHCVHGGRAGDWHHSFVFHPGYHGGPSALGAWSYSRATTFRGWTDSSSYAYDQAVVQLRPSGGVNIVNRLGGNGVTTGGGPVVKNTRIWGYPASHPFDGKIPYYCDRDTYAWGSSDAAINCGLNGGASGGPWLRDRGTNNLGYVWAVTSRCVSDGNGTCTLRTMIAAPNPSALKNLLS